MSPELTSSLEAIMRALLAILALLGVAGIVLGVVTIIRGMSAPGGIPFRFENYGGPGPIIAGLVILATSLYLLSIWKHKE
jgi:formate hydrogenlyase subunit 3/multisubunit Na+/H+ antiporter MnhD subunit